MYHIGKYRESDLMSDLICENHPMLLVMSRFGISMGFGDHTIGYVCKKNDVDTDTFLAVVNLLVNEETDDKPGSELLSAVSLVKYLKNSHTYFLDFRLPAIRLKLVEALEGNDSDMAVLIIRYYDEYVEEVRRHMAYEEQTVFPYVESLLKGEQDKKYNIDIFSRKHDNIECRLTELKNIIIKYCPIKSSNELNSVMFDIFLCAGDLLSHTKVEESLFIPLIRRIENNKM